MKLKIRWKSTLLTQWYEMFGRFLRTGWYHVDKPSLFSVYAWTRTHSNKQDWWTALRCLWIFFWLKQKMEEKLRKWKQELNKVWNNLPLVQMGTLTIQKPTCRLHRLSLTYLTLSHQEGKKDVVIMQTFIILNFWNINREVVEI